MNYLDTQEIENTLLNETDKRTLVEKALDNLNPNLVKSGIVLNNFEEFTYQTLSTLEKESDVVGVVKPYSFYGDRRISEMLTEVGIEINSSAVSNDRFATITLPEHLSQKINNGDEPKRLILLIQDDHQFNSSRSVIKRCIQYVNEDYQKLRILTGDLSDLQIKMLILNESIELE